MPSGAEIISFRVTGKIPQDTAAQFDETLNLNSPSLLILSDEILEGTIVHFSADSLYGCDCY